MQSDIEAKTSSGIAERYSETSIASATSSGRAEGGQAKN